MDPSDRVESCNLSNFLWQLVSTWPLRKIKFGSSGSIMCHVYWFQCKDVSCLLFNYMLAVTWIVLAPVANVSVSVSQYLEVCSDRDDLGAGCQSGRNFRVE